MEHTTASSLNGLRELFFEELNKMMNSPDEQGKKFEWQSYGDDALYKFLEDNCIPWNNGENTDRLRLRC